MYTHLDMKPTLFWLLDLNWQYRKHFHYTKEISKYTKENMQAERFGSNFSHIALINLISWPVCHILTDASLDTHINVTYVHHLPSLTSEICQKCQMSAMTDDIWRTYVILIWVSREPSAKIWQHGQEIKLIRPMCEKESQNAPLEYFPLYILRFSL